MLYIQALFFWLVRFAAGLCALGFGIWGGVTVAIQVTGRLRTDIWAGDTIADALRELGISVPDPGWPGIEHIVQSVLEWPGILLIGAITVAFLLVCLWAQAGYELVQTRIADTRVKGLVNTEAPQLQREEI